MPYSTISELPASVRNVLPNHAQDIYKEAFNNAYDEYKDSRDRKEISNREETAHRVAWNAVKNKYSKGEDSKWHPKK